MTPPAGPAPAARPLRRPRVLVIAEAANPEWVSVPLVGWSLAKALRDKADVHIVTQARNRDAFLRAGLAEGQDFTAIDSEALAGPAHRLAERLRMGQGRGWTVYTAITSRLSYPYFERLVWRRFRARLQAGAFDLVHRVTPLTPTANSSLAPRCARLGIPFILGPLNGGVPWPPGFEQERWREREMLSHIRGLYRLSPARARMLTASRVIIAGSRATGAEIPARHRHKLVHVPENAIDPARFHRRASPPSGLPLRGVFIGRLVPYKGADMLIEAAKPFLAEGRLHLDIVGAGPMEDALRAQVGAAGLEGAVRFHGWVAHEGVQDVLAQAHMLTFPSIREFGGGVVLEAMATGVVPMVCDYAGPGELVDDGCGIKVPIGNRAQVIAGFRAALGRVLDDPACLEPLARGGLQNVARHFTWERKAQHMLDIYHWALNPQGPIPVQPSGEPSGQAAMPGAGHAAPAPI